MILLNFETVLFCGLYKKDLESKHYVLIGWRATMRDLQFYISPNTEHLMDWFHITMRITVM